MMLIMKKARKDEKVKKKISKPIGLVSFSFGTKTKVLRDVYQLNTKNFDSNRFIQVFFIHHNDSLKVFLT